MTEVEYVPEEVRDCKLITIYVSFEPDIKIVVKEYRTLDDLVCLNPLQDKPCFSSPAKIIWSTPYQDYPSYEDIDSVDFDQIDLPIESGAYDTKLGGYPFPIQNYPCWQPEAAKEGKYVCQIVGSSRINLHFPGDGCLYICRSSNAETNGWGFDFQFY